MASPRQNVAPRRGQPAHGSNAQTPATSANGQPAPAIVLAPATAQQGGRGRNWAELAAQNASAPWIFGNGQANAGQAVPPAASQPQRNQNARYPASGQSSPAGPAPAIGPFTAANFARTALPSPSAPHGSFSFAMPSAAQPLATTPTMPRAKEPDVFSVRMAIESFGRFDECESCGDEHCWRPTTVKIRLPSSVTATGEAERLSITLDNGFKQAHSVLTVAPVASTGQIPLMEVRLHVDGDLSERGRGIPPRFGGFEAKPGAAKEYELGKHSLDGDDEVEFIFQRRVVYQQDATAFVAQSFDQPTIANDVCFLFPSWPGHPPRMLWARRADIERAPYWRAMLSSAMDESKLKPSDEPLPDIEPRKSPDLVAGDQYDSDEDELFTSVNRPSPVSSNGLPVDAHRIVIRDHAPATLKAVLTWLCTGKIEFAPLRSSGAGARQLTVANALTIRPGMPRLVSPKSVARLAEKLELPQLTVRDLTAEHD